MRSDVPPSIRSSAHKLSADALITLFAISLPDLSEIRISPTVEYFWQGHTYEFLPCTMTGVGRTSDGEHIRPRFNFVNPGSIFSQDAYFGRLDNSIITRIRILRDDLVNNRNYSVTEQFRVSRVLSIGQDVISLELRDILDGQNFTLPARKFMPPEFPHVRLQ